MHSNINHKYHTDKFPASRVKHREMALAWPLLR